MSTPVEFALWGSWCAQLTGASPVGCLRRAEETLAQEDNPQRLPVREVIVAMLRFECAAQNRQALEAEEALAQLLTAAGEAPPRSPLWLIARLPLVSALWQSLDLQPGKSRPAWREHRLEQAATVAGEVLGALEGGEGEELEEKERERRQGQARTVGLEATRQLFLMHGERGRRALEQADGWAGGPEVSIRRVALERERFEQSGDARHLARGIRLAEQALEGLQGRQGGARERVGALEGLLAELLARELLQLWEEPTEGSVPPPDDVVEKCARALRLAQTGGAGVISPLPWALEAHAWVHRDWDALQESIQQDLRAAGTDRAEVSARRIEAARRLIVRERVAPFEQSGLYEALAVLDAELAVEPPPDPVLQLRAQLHQARILVRLPGSARRADAVWAAQACVRGYPPGHGLRALALAALAQALVTQDLQIPILQMRDALEAALEAEVLTEGAGPLEVLTAVNHTLSAWLSHGGSLQEVQAMRVMVTERLLEVLPTQIAAVADRRALQLHKTVPTLAERYEELALAACERGWGAGGDIELAQQRALQRGELRSLHRIAVKMAQRSPERSALLLARAQAPWLHDRRVLQALEDSAPGGDPVLQSCARQGRALCALVRGGRAEGSDTQDKALRESGRRLADSLAQLQGPECRHLGPLTDFEELRRRGAPCLIVAAGESGGVAIAVTAEAPPDVIPLPGLCEKRVEARLRRYQAALRRFERDHEGKLHPFLEELSAQAAWLEETALGALRPWLRDVGWRFIPCGALACLPWSAVTADYPLLYSPGLQIPAPAPIPSRRCLLVCAPEHRGQDPLPESERLQQRCRVLLGEGLRVLPGSACTTRQVLEAAQDCGVLVFYAHGCFQQKRLRSSGVLLQGLERLDVRTIQAHPEAFAGRLVVLASCCLGQVDSRVPSQMLGVASALLAAGAHTVIAPAWPVDAYVSSQLIYELLSGLKSGLSPAWALVRAQGQIGAAPEGGGIFTHLRQRRVSRARRRTRADKRHARPYFWRAYLTYGVPHPGMQDEH